jgi:hypothetical protein
MEKMLLLLLGIAINGEFKESFIEQIQQQLETQIQINLIPYIQLVTEDINFSVSKSILLKIDSTTTTKPSQPTTVKTTLTLEVNANPPPPPPLTSEPSLNELNTCESNTSLQSNVSSTSSTTSFANQCQLLLNTNANSNDPTSSPMSSSHTSNQLILTYSSMDQVNYFLNTKLMQNVQRIVDERDSYLESIIELQQDKDYLSFKLNSCLALNTNCNSSSLNEATLKQLNIINNNNNNCNSNSNSSNSGNLNSPNCNANVNSISSNNNNNCNSSNGNLVDLVGNSGSVKNVSNCCNLLMNETSLINSSSLIELSDPQALLVLIESIYKEIASANTIIESASSFKNSSEHLLNGGSSSNCLLDNANSETLTNNGEMSNHGGLFNLAEKINALNIENSNNKVGTINNVLLSDLKNRKLLANNWNQKIAIELVECKVKLRQLINEM